MAESSLPALESGAARAAPHGGVASHEWKRVGRPPRLVLRFAILTALALAAAMAGIVSFAYRSAAEAARERVALDAQLLAETTLQEQLRRSDLAEPVRGERLAALDELFRRAMIVDGAPVQVKLWNAGGTLTYSNEHRLIGTRIDHPRELHDVLEGEVEHEVTRTDLRSPDGDTEEVKVLEAFVPVRLAGAAEPGGALELYQDYGLVARRARGEFLPLLAVLGAAFLGLYAALFPILRRVTAALQARNRDLREQAAALERSLAERDRAEKEIERLLAAERAARAEAETAQRLLASQNARLREADRMKDEFVALVSHELRTPLTSILGYLEIVLDEDAGKLSDEQRHFLGVVERNSARLLRLVGDLLLVAEIESGKLAFEFGPVDFGQVVTDSVHAQRPRAQERGVRLALTAVSVPALEGDRARLAQLVDNLLSNAIKFTPEDGEVRVSVVPTEAGVLLEVADSGIGVPTAEGERLFERFFRASTATERVIQGTGLGLAIAKAIVEGHRGRIWFESDEGGGTTFRVELPLRRSDVPGACELEIPA